MPKPTQQDPDEQSDVDQLVGQNIHRFRTAKGMSQAQLAEQMALRTGQPVAQQTIVKLEKGTRPLRYSEAAVLAEVLGVPLDALHEGSAAITLAAVQTTYIAEVRALGAEVDDIAHRLADALVRLSLAVSYSRQNGGESSALNNNERIADALTGTDWGKALSTRIMAALKENQDLAELRPEFTGTNYRDVLKKVAAPRDFTLMLPTLSGGN